MAALAEGTNATATATNSVEKVSYAIGVLFGNQLKGSNVTTNEVNPEILAGAMRDVLSGGELKVSDAEVRTTVMAFQAQKRQELMAKRKEQGEKNLKEGTAFLEANKTKEGIKTQSVDLPGGKTSEFQYKVITEGTGVMPGPTDTVMVNYRGTLIDGKEFDDSAKHGGPTQMRVNGVIPGWSRALQMMKTGAKWQLFIPADLAYGEAGRPGIDPNSTLIFDVELVSIVPQTTPVAGAAPQPLTSDIIKVPSKDGLAHGEKIEVIKADDAKAMSTNGAANNGQPK